MSVNGRYTYGQRWGTCFANGICIPDRILNGKSRFRTITRRHVDLQEVASYGVDECRSGYRKTSGAGQDRCGRGWATARGGGKTRSRARRRFLFVRCAQSSANSTKGVGEKEGFLTGRTAEIPGGG